MSDLERALAEAERWIDVDGVEGVGQGVKDGADCIIVYVSLPTDTMRSRIPETVHDVPVTLIESGIITPEA